jgi:predicted PurR-regulated permease PerM
VGAAGDKKTWEAPLGLQSGAPLTHERSLRPWVNFAGVVLVIAVLYWGRPVIVPVVMAGLLTFVLSPVVALLRRAIGQVPAVILVGLATCMVLGLAGWLVTRELTSIVHELPSYRENIRQKIRDIRAASKGGSVETIQDAVEDIKRELNDRATGSTAAPIVVTSSQVAGLWGLPTALGPYLEPVATAGLVAILVVFMLLEREGLRNRIVKLLGYGRLTATTRAFDEAGTRVSRYLLFQTMVNSAFGLGIGIGLYWIGVPYALLWACLSIVLRFIPYIGPWIGAGGPILVSMAVFDGWMEPISVALLFGALELATNVILEPFFYSGAAGISEVGLMVSLAFWTWLWGPLGLLLATPVTVCLVVMGKHLPGLDFISTAMSDEPVFADDMTFYQRLLADDQAEAAELLRDRIEQEGLTAAFDALMVPALNFAERDREEGRLSPGEEAALIQTSTDLLMEVESRAESASEATDPIDEPVRVLGYPVGGVSDVLALRMLRSLLPKGLTLEISSPKLMASDVVAMLEAGKYRAVCIADLPPSGPSKSRYLVKRIRAAAPGVRILVGRWGPSVLTDETQEILLRNEAHRVAVTLKESQEELAELAPSGGPKPGPLQDESTT